MNLPNKLTILRVIMIPFSCSSCCLAWAEARPNGLHW